MLAQVKFKEDIWTAISGICWYETSDDCAAERTRLILLLDFKNISDFDCEQTLTPVT